MTCAVAYQKMLGEVSPHCAIFPDMVYGRRGELFDNCLRQDIDAIVWRPSHKSNAIILKRYTGLTRDADPVSLSDNSWTILKDMRWLPSHRAVLRNELHSVYANSDWFSECGTQFDKCMLTRDELIERLGLDPAKKTAVIFPHIVWDASMSRGKDLFADYQEWLVHTVRAACANTQVNWVIKIHPANVGKSLKDGYQGEPAEEIVLREHIGPLPSHVFLIKAQTDISTYSLLELMDYCVTVRGTTGIEAASRGIPVITGGTGRYDRKGFTLDSDSQGEYLEKLATIQNISKLSEQQQELAERYAFGLFLLRPLQLKTVTLEFAKEHGGKNNFTNARINARTAADWHNAPDVRSLAEWFGDAHLTDFLIAPDLNENS